MPEPDVVDRVLLAVQQIPPGQVASYGTIGRIAGAGPRQVGTIMRRHGAEVPWWRVVDSRGHLVPLEQARPHWRAEGIGVAAHGRGCRMADHAADPIQLVGDYEEACRDLGWQEDNS